MIIYESIPGKNRSSPVTRLVIIYGGLSAGRSARPVQN